MNAPTPSPAATDQLNRAARLLQISTEPFAKFSKKLDPVKAALRVVEDLGDATTARAAKRLGQTIPRFEPTVTMIGQIKSGKTTLVNSMTGHPSLLPADVNPWTSVVTSLHLHPDPKPSDTCAKFRFFEAGEWDQLVTGGGRIGELASRAGAEEELGKIKAQVEAMREKSRARLGRKFEMLLGAEHRYDYVDAELLERYVCLGDDIDTPNRASHTQGRFADITKSADVMLHQPGLPMPLCIRDTPGVNDTFMMREQITIRAIRESRTCVVVLSAHQALSSTDLALVRLISSVSSRDVIIFVNRIDELSDPTTDVPLIHDSIRATLKLHKGPEDTQILFGSALWAETAANGHLSDLPKASQDALFRWAEVTNVPDRYDNDPNGFVWELSGVPQLFEVMAQQMSAGAGAEFIDDITTRTSNLLNSLTLSHNLEAKRAQTTTTLNIPREVVQAELDQMLRQRTEQLINDLQAAIDALAERSQRSHEGFLLRATEALTKHLELYGEQTAWTYDPAGLRMLLNTGYKVFARNCRSAYETALSGASEDLKSLCQRALDLPEDLFDPTFPSGPDLPPPVTLSQTIALDLQKGWWKGWWSRRRSYADQAKGYYDIIHAETVSLLRDLLDDQAHEAAELIHDRVTRLLNEQIEILSESLCAETDGPPRVDQLLGIATLQERQARVDLALRNLEEVQDDK